MSEVLVNNVKQVLIPAAGTLKEQWEELVLERSNGSIRAAGEYLHLYRPVWSQGLWVSLPLRSALGQSRAARLTHGITSVHPLKPTK